MTYWTNLEAHLDSLVQDGYCFLPSLKDFFNLDDVYEQCLGEMGKKNYAENTQAHLAFVNQSGITAELSAALFKLAKKDFGYQGTEENQYHVSRLVRPGKISEGYRGHFDSHLFTLVVPIQIPSGTNSEEAGELLFFPGIRNEPTGELSNFYGKLFYKKFAMQSGFESLARSNSLIVADFKDLRPLLFLGRQTFHGNKPVSSSLHKNRLTLLSHFFDPSPRWGAGNILRKIRLR